MNRVLILFAHPALQKSRVNRMLIAGVQDLDGVTFHDLYEAYPEFDIDVSHEQALLESHDVIVFHHPFFWYSTPAILKEWQDLVLQHGWAYGHTGQALHGKRLLNAITTGGRDVAYRKDGYNRLTVQELLVPIAQTAALCGMDYLPPFVVHGTLQMTEDRIQAHTEDYRRVILALRDDAIDLDKAKAYACINERLDTVLIREGVDHAQ